MPHSEESASIGKGEFSAEKFVELLLGEGAEARCDDSSQVFRENDHVPTFYNDEAFKRGQQFYQRNVFVMFYAKLMGLVSVLAVPTILRVLQFTKMSSEPKTAYRRYLATLFHMIVWYEDDFEPGSDLWKSLEEVRSKHNVASRRVCKAGAGSISQKDMALTQFGFMGYVITRTEEIGIRDATDEDLRCFIHLWKVIGFLMGIEDRFNICRDDVAETRAICELLIGKVFKPNVEEQRPDFVEMSEALIDAMWCMQPTLNPTVVMIRLMKLLNRSSAHPLVVDLSGKLTRTQRFTMGLMESTITTYRYTPLKIYHNAVTNMSFWLMKNFPFLGFYSFGYGNSYVKILNARPSQSG